MEQAIKDSTLQIMILNMNLPSKGEYSVGEINDIKFGTVQVNKLYIGTDLVFEKVSDTTAPITTPRPDATITYTSPQTVYLDVNEMCDTYYTLDGTTPTTASTKYTGDGIYIEGTTTFKYFSVDLAGNVEAAKTTVYTIDVVDTPTTTVSPTSTVQNTIPFTVTLTTDEAGATIYYRLGTGAQQTYTAPFQVNQNMAGVLGTSIPVHYWAVGAEGTEAEKTITYDTSGSKPVQNTLTATAGTGQVALSWTASQNATSYTVFKSTVAGTLGTLISATQYMTGLSYTDTDVVAGTTYYYTIRASNYGQVTDSVQKSAVPTSAPAVASWRYLKLEGYGASETDQSVTTRLVEFEAWEGTTNHMTGATIVSGQTPSNAGTGGTLAQIKDGTKSGTSNTYPLWWTSPTPNGNVIVDLLAQRPLTKLSWYGYSVSGVQRTNRFKVLASNTNNGTDWTLLWDNSTGQAGVQGILPAGYDKTL
jgi:hypothetical protein